MKHKLGLSKQLRRMVRASVHKAGGRLASPRPRGHRREAYPSNGFARSALGDWFVSSLRHVA
jgi:hypothetical protein